MLREQLIQCQLREQGYQMDVIHLQEKLVGLSQENSTLRIKAMAAEAKATNLEKQHR